MSVARAAILDAVRGQPEPVSVAALVRLTRLHENTVREHLNALVGTGRVRRTRAPATGRGRPAWLYLSWEGGPEEAQYAGLAAALSRAVAGSAADPTAVAEAQGRAWGRDMVVRQHDDDGSSTAASVVVATLDDLRFAPRVAPEEPTVVRLERCPLLETAHRFPDVVCAVHLGMVRGVLERLGESTEGTGLRPFAEPGACLLELPQLALSR
ncbi:MAG: helix-turn-helix domain-containing protein [Nocardioides sp.]|nr:helix-turn-helix domain-containing protein [Nocardioides sp.]